MRPPTRAARVAFWLIAALLGPLLESASADIGVPLVRATEGRFEVQILVSPAPLRVGASEWTVWVRDRASGDLVREASFELEFTHVEKGAPTPAHPSHHDAAITRTLGPDAARASLRSARLDLQRPGRWSGALRVTSAEGSARIPFEFEVEPTRSVLLRHWVAFGVVPIGLMLFALHQRRVHGPARHRAP